MSMVLLNEVELMNTIERVRNYSKGLSTGFADLDYMISGLQRGSLYILGGRPSMGKTMLAMNMIYSIAVNQKKSVLFVSLDQSKARIVPKLLQINSGVNIRNLYSKNISEEEMNQLRRAAVDLGEAQIWIDDTAGMYIERLQEIVCDKVSEGGIDFFVIDYLQLMNSGKKCISRQEEVSDICKILKNIARENDIPILVLSQLNRLPECRPEHRPMLSDLRDSGAIEQYADVVMFIYRDEYYHSYSEKKSTAEIIIAKNEIGPIGTVELKFLPEKGKFENTSAGY